MSLGIKYHCREWADCKVEVRLLKLGTGLEIAVGFQTRAGELVTLLELALARVYRLRPTSSWLRNGYNWGESSDPVVAMRKFLQKQGEVRTFTNYFLRSGSTSFVICKTEIEISEVVKASNGVAVSDGVVLGPLARRLRAVLDWIAQQPTGTQRSEQSCLLDEDEASDDSSDTSDGAAAYSPEPPTPVPPVRPELTDALPQRSMTEIWNAAVGSEALKAKPKLSELSFASLLAVCRKRGVFTKCRRKYELLRPTLRELPVDISAYVERKCMSMDDKQALVYLLVRCKAYKLKDGSVYLKV